jgi:carboxypeptidase family protein
MRTRTPVLVALIALVVTFLAGSAAGSQSTEGARSALPAWGSEPVPQFGSGRSELHGISVLSANQAWAVGVMGLSQDQNAKPLVERWDGSSWSIVDVPDITGAELYGVAAVAPNDVWMAGTFNNTRESLVLHWDGGSVQRVATPNPGANRNDLYAVTAVAADDVWAVGSKSSGVTDPLALHWNGAKWREVTAPGTASYDELRSVTAVASDDVWAVGVLDNDAAALHWDGSSWTRVDVPVSGGSTSLSAVSAAAADEVWAVGQDAEGTVSVRWNGAKWTVVDVPDSGGFLRDDLRGLVVIGPDDAWAGGTSYLGGDAGSIALHWNGKQWKSVSTPHPPKSASQLRAAGAAPDGTLLMAGSLKRRASVLRLEGGALRAVPVEQAGTDANELLGISAAAPDDIWAVGSLGEFNPDALTLHYDGSEWSRVNAPAPPTGTRLEDVVAIAADDAWAVGYTNPAGRSKPVALHWDGTRWRSTTVPRPGDKSTRLLAVDALGPDDVWAVGEYAVSSASPSTVIVHWNGRTWRPADLSGCNPYGGLAGLTFLADDDGWAVGHASTCHWNGRRWALVPSPQPRPNYFEIDYPLQDVSGVASDDVWAVGGVVYDFIEYLDFGSFVEHWDGTAWQRVPNPSGVVINGVEAVSADEVWAVGRDDFGPIIVRSNGRSWADIPTPDRDHGLDLLGMTRVGDELWSAGRSLADGADGGLRSLVQRAPSPTQGAVIGSSNVGGATVTYQGPVSGVVETDPTGSFQVGGLPAGRYRFTLSFAGCQPVTEKTTIAAGRTRLITLHADC